MSKLHNLRSSENMETKKIEEKNTKTEYCTFFLDVLKTELSSFISKMSCIRKSPDSEIREEIQDFWEKAMNTYNDLVEQTEDFSEKSVKDNWQENFKSKTKELFDNFYSLMELQNKDDSTNKTFCLFLSFSAKNNNQESVLPGATFPGNCSSAAFD